MKRYGYLRFWVVVGHGGSLYLQSSSPDELQSFSAAFEPYLTELTPKGRRYPHEPEDFVRCYVGLKEQTATLYWRALRFLCESGWEPVTVAYQTSSEGVVSEHDFSSYPQIHLRKELE